ncbi:ABC transporter substrate-binding protein [Flavobacterium cerinum]|uniref:ABC transporter substrate-binding protein n=1 Tax=Flavobacterium cerinum TaxID=2502784 RepID=A0A3S3U3I8_9FLAO|nr:ABC transporter substrate-binding protein [Flavobacterium cerinum]RWX01042.1 ABC transporter substrate-binding protein [Flavobacterium cerinum]
MKLFYPLFLFVVLAFTGCKKETSADTGSAAKPENTIKHAKGLEIYRYKGFTVVKVTNPWPDAKETFTYVMQQKDGIVPDSLKKYTVVSVPLKSVVVTSTTHVPSLEMLGVENTLVGFPTTDYISSEKTRARVDAGKVKEVGTNESLNTEVMIDLAPDAVVGFSISSNNKTMNNLKQSGMVILYNGDWTEQTPLGKAEWIKFFGALYDQDDKAAALFNDVEKEYNNALALVKNVTGTPTVLAGALYQDHWYLPQGGSWPALFLKDAKAKYLWADSEGTGSLNLSFETVLDKAQNADFWIGPSQFTSLKEMTDSNPHYGEFKAFKTHNVYSFSTKKGKKGGLIYYELAPNRPDLVLKDMISILHPDVLPDYKLHFFEKLK